MVAREGAPLVHARFRDLAAQLRAGDLLVVNESAVLPAALPARRADGTALTLHLSTPEPPPGALGGRADGRPTGRWVVELRRDGARFAGAAAGETLALPGGGRARARRAVPRPRPAVGRAARSARAAARLPRRPRRADPLRPPAAAAPARRSPDDLRPRAGQRRVAERRPARSRRASCTISPRAAIGVARLVLHTGVSSPERGERPYPERFADPRRDRGARRRDPPRRRARDRGRHDRHARAGDRRGARRRRPRRRGLDVARDHARARRARRRRADHRLARARARATCCCSRRSPAPSWSRAPTPPPLALRYRWHEFGDSHLLLRE